MSDNSVQFFNVTFGATVSYGEGHVERIHKEVAWDHSDVTHTDLSDVFKDFLRGIGYIV
jgi:hypothetical protein